MTAIEIKAKKEELIKEIGSDTTLLDSALKYVKKLKRNKLSHPVSSLLKKKRTLYLKVNRMPKKDWEYRTKI